MKKLLLIFFITLFFLLAAFLSLLGSNAGSAWLLAQVTQHVYKTLAYESFQGTFLSAFTFKNLHIRSKDQDFLAHEIDFHWHPSALLHLSLSVDQLKISSVQWHVFHAQESTHSQVPLFKKLDLPWYLNSVEIKNLQISEFYFHQKRERITFEDFSGNLLLHSKKLNVSFVLKNIENSAFANFSAFDHAKLSLSGQAYGSFQHFNWNLGVLVQKPAEISQAHSPWHFSGEGSSSDIQLSQVQNPLWPKALALSLKYQWFPFSEINANLKGKVDPSLWSHAYRGALNLDVDFLAKNLSQPEMASELTLNYLKGDINNRQVNGHGTVKWANHVLAWQQWDIALGKSYLRINGELAKQSNLTWDIHILDFSHWFSDAKGSLLSAGKIQGDYLSPFVKVDADIRRLKFFSFGAESFNAQISMNDAEKKFNLNLEGKNLFFNKERADRFVAQSHGSWQKHMARLFFSNSIGALNLVFQGGFEGQQWRGTLQEMTIKLKSFPIWKLERSVELNIGRDLFLMRNHLCLQQEKNKLCAQLAWMDEKKSLDIHTSVLDLKLFKAFFPAEFFLQEGKGQLNAEIYLNKHLHPFGVIKLQLWPILGRYHIDDTHSLPLRTKQTIWQADFIEGKPATFSGALESNLINLKFLGALPEWAYHKESDTWFEQPLNAELNGKVKDFSLLSSFVPSLQMPKGQLNVTAHVNGTLNVPKVKLTTTLKQASVHFVPYNLDLNHLNLDLVGDLDQSLILSGTADAKEGYIKLSGDVSQLLTEPILNLNVTGGKFLVADLPSYKIWVTPDLHLKIESTGLKLSGKIFIPKARLNFVDYGKSIVGLTSDVTYVDEDSTPFNFLADILLQLGDDITIRYGGLRGHVKGELRIKQAADEAATAVGAIHLSGATYTAYGQMLTIQKGIAAYSGGDVANPALDIQAIKAIKNAMPSNADPAGMQGLQWLGPDNTLTVGIMVTGSLSQRKITLFSRPAGLSQSDILSYLILGVPASQAGNAGGQLLLSAASSFGNGDGTASPIARLQSELRNTFGVDVSVGNVSQYDAASQSVTQGTALILTKTLSPKLFLSYSAGVGQVANQFKVRYQMARSWMVQTESSALGNGADVYYTIDRN